MQTMDRFRSQVTFDRHARSPVHMPHLLQVSLDGCHVLSELLLGSGQPQPLLIPLELGAAHLLLDRLYLLLQLANQGQLALHSMRFESTTMLLAKRMLKY